MAIKKMKATPELHKALAQRQAAVDVAEARAAEECPREVLSDLASASKTRRALPR